VSPFGARRWILVVVGAALGILAWGLLRFALGPCPDPPHYHANWAVVVDGKQLDFSGDRYMEAVATCAATDVVRPAERVHMHNNEGDVVHVHHTGVAWGHFFDNLGMDVGPDYLIMDRERRFFEGEGGTLKFVLNGFVVGEISALPIGSGDRLLISYGPESPEQVVDEQFPRVPADAEEYNERDDPAGCSGAVDVGLWERLRAAFWTCPA
jgi:hypothetical protein